ncbi:cell division protein FtsK [Bacillus sp. BF2-3]|uniref:FtsK/SpoIIIE domain-containing protein n=1 Tax=Bacillus cereus group TaxID=86661 RepID=UPI000C28397C|nr:MULTISPECIES: FtsK/SpoIIIE domain-containing protein [Bacillus cereus group]KAA0748509.1 cell division protein FtsK [Bacillus sp. BF2-3]MCU5043269.1 FtsK/SpoIIIE domain-containing protein [Bacillus cereus]MDA2656155.1 FtsK/SpoIIIE domain-containing protein [Bacillus cereus]
MIFELVSSVAVGGVVFLSKMHQKGATNDASKIQRICANCGLKVKEGKEIRTIQLLRKTRNDWGVEYAYRIPLGLSFSDFEQKMQHLEDGLNHKSKVYDFKLQDFKSLRLRKDILKQTQNIINKKKLVRKEIELSYDGLLKIRVYERGIPDFVKFEEDMMKQCKGWEVPIGYTRDGLVKHDFDQLSHMISAGMTDMGKSNVLKLIITSLVCNQSENIKLFLIDLKGGLSFNRYRFLNQVESIAKNPEEALKTLKELQDKLNARNEYLLEKGYEDIKEAGDPVRYFVIVDEAADIAPYQECQDIIVDIGRRGRAAGFRLIYATQYPTNSAMPSQLRQNIGARVCFRLQTEVGSRAVLDEGGAESLPNIKGRAIYQTNEKKVLQTIYIDNKQIDNIIKPHINIRARKEHQDAKTSHEGSENGKYTLELEETRLS